jgi:Hg(II)-responsive transcriptional regulator
MNLTTSELARQAGVGSETIRYYERRALLPRPPRSTSGYRQYGPEAVTRIRFIKRAQALGFSLSEIDELLSLRLDDQATAHDVRERSKEKILDIEEKMRDLARMKDELERLVEACSGRDPASECSILRSLSGES